MFIALAVAMGVCWHWQQLTAVPALFLGAIASAIAETDDNWLGRIKSVLLSLLCFAAAATAVVLLFPYPLPFVIGMALATFSLTLLGALGERYASISQATVALSIYAMIGMDQHGSHHPSIAWHGAALLLIGATWYGVLSILWTILFANRPVRERLSRLFFSSWAATSSSRPICSNRCGRATCMYAGWRWPSRTPRWSARSMRPRPRS